MTMYSNFNNSFFIIWTKLNSKDQKSNYSKPKLAQTQKLGLITPQVNITSNFEISLI